MSQAPESSIFDATDDVSIADSLQGGVEEVWKDTHPPGTHSTVVLETTQFVLTVPEESAVFLQAGGRWGSAKGNVAIYVRRPEESPLSFAFIASMSFLDSGDIFEDTVLVKEVRDHLPGPAGNVCVFREWSGIGKTQGRELALAQPNAANALNTLNEGEALFGLGSPSRHTGVAVMFTLNLSDWTSSPAAILLNRLSDIDRLNSASSITSLTLGCAIIRPLHPEPLTSLTFLANVDAFPIFEKALLKDICLSLTISRPDSSPSKALLKLKGQLALGLFDEQNPWISVGTLTIDRGKHIAELVVEPKDRELSMVELGIIKLGNVDLRVAYTFGQAHVQVDAALSAVVKVGDYSVQGTVVFRGLRPSHLLFNIEETLEVGELLRAVFGGAGLPEDFIRLSFSDLSFCYSWNATSLPLNQASIDPGFTASASIDVFGFKARASVKFAPGGKDKGICVLAELEEPVDVFFLSLYGCDYQISAGPRITYSTRASDTKGLAIFGGLTLLGGRIGDVALRYGERSTKDKEPFLQADIVVEDLVIKGGKTEVNLQLYKLKGKTYVRLNGVPLREIWDIISDAMLFSKIRELTRADPCKEINIPVKDLIYMGFWPKLEFSEEQPEQEAGEMPSCSFEVSCTCSIKLGKEKVVELVLDPFTLVMKAPKVWEDIWKEIGKALVRSLGKIALCLLTNVDKFSQVLAFYHARYMAEKWMKETLRAWLCRHRDAPVPNPGPPEDVAPAPALAPLPQPIKSKRNKAGHEVALSERLQGFIVKLRTRAPHIIECLETVLEMIGEGNPTKARPDTPKISIPSDKRPEYTKSVQLLLEGFRCARDRDWEGAIWEEDYAFIAKPFGRQWDMCLWGGLHEIKICLGLLAGAYRAKYSLIFFNGNEPTWPANGQPDPRPEVEVFRKINELDSGWLDLVTEATSVNESQLGLGFKIWREAGEIARAYVDSYPALTIAPQGGSSPFIPGKNPGPSSLNTTSSSFGV